MSARSYLSLYEEAFGRDDEYDEDTARLAHIQSKHSPKALELITRVHDTLRELLALEKTAQAEAGTEGPVLQIDEYPLHDALSAIAKCGLWMHEGKLSRKTELNDAPFVSLLAHGGH